MRYAAVVLATAVLVPVASGIAAGSQTGSVDSKLVGKWTRKITSADVKRAGGLSILIRSVCTLTIKKSGVAHLDCTGVGAFDGSIAPAGINRVHIDLGDLTQNVYRWRVSGRLLTFAKLKDPAADRVAAMWGVWKRK